MPSGPLTAGGENAPAEGRRGLIRAAGAVGAATLLSRALGYLRDMVIARSFGAGLASDAFIAAFRIPSLLRELLGEGALSASFIPVFAGEAERAGRPRAMRLAGAAFTILAGVAGTLTVLGILLAPALVTIVAPGFQAVPGKWELTVALTRWMFPFLFFVALSALLGGLLNALGHFVTPALAPVCFNIAMIGSTLLLASRLDPPILALPAGVLLGGAAMLAIQIPSSARRGFTGPRWPRRADEGLRRIARLMLPATAGLGVTQVNVAVSGLLASFLPQGSVSHLFYAMRLIQFPIGVVGVTIGTVALPSMSSDAARRAPQALAGTLGAGLRLAFFLTTPILAALTVFARPIVRLLFERGAFTPEATAATTLALQGYMAGLIFYVINRILTSAFYALQDTRTPMRAGAVAVGVNIVAGFALMGPLAAMGLALGTALAAMANTVMLLIRLRSHLGAWMDGRFLSALGRMGGAAALAGAFGLALGALGPSGMGRGALGAVLLLAEIGAAGGVYLALAAAFGCEELRWARQALARRGAAAGPVTTGENGL